MIEKFKAISSYMMNLHYKANSKIDSIWVFHLFVDWILSNWKLEFAYNNWKTLQIVAV